MASQVGNIVGTWYIVDYSQHPECKGCSLTISYDDENQNSYRLYASVVNSMNCSLEHNPANNQWKVGPVAATLMLGPPEKMEKEDAIGNLISGIQNLEVQGEQHLIIRTSNGEQIRLERSQ